MQFQLTALLAILSIGTTANAAAIAKRHHVAGGFTVATTSTCPFPANIPSGEIVHHENIVSGSQCGTCNPISTGTTSFKSITGAYIDPRCNIYLYQKSDCSGYGADTGNGCWAPEGGIMAYKISCPSWIQTNVTEPACYSPPS